MTIISEKTNSYMNFINGSWISTQSNEFYQVINPANKEDIIGKFPLSVEEDVNNAVNSAHRAFKKWRKVPASERVSYIYKFIDLFDENKEKLANVLSREQGKPLKESINEVSRGLNEMRFVAGEAVRLEGLTLPSDRRGVLNIGVRVPIGVVAAINPWNFPVLTPLRKAIPALVSGCTIVLKPASETPLTSVIITDLLKQAGLPSGTVNLIMGSGKQIGDSLISHPLVNGVSFTGSTEVGRNIYEKAAKNLIKVQLELGGNNPAAVAEYSDLEDAALQIVEGCYSNSGQRCTAIRRVVVLDKHADHLEKMIIKQVQGLKIGDGFSAETNVGPIINESALNELIRVMDSAKKQGANIVLGGHQLTEGQYEKGFYLEPTVISGVTTDMEIAQKEIFGPVLVLIRVSSFEELIEVSNDTQYGLTASIFTDRMDLAYQFMEDVESGMVHVNNGTVSEGHMPFGGVKKSGVGPYSIGGTNKDFYTELKIGYIKNY